MANEGVRRTARLPLCGRIDSNNAVSAEAELRAALSDTPDASVILDASALEYISSAGLRVLLRLNRDFPDLSIENVSAEVYEVLEMTGFTEILSVKRAFRSISIEGCEQIGSGANGAVYRIDNDSAVKIYNYPEALDEIMHEREKAKLALVLGLPTAISYEVVRVGESYGAVFELLNARSFSKILSESPEKLDWCADEYAELLKKIHSTSAPEGSLPDMKDIALAWAKGASELMPEEEGKKLVELVCAVPSCGRIVHGDYHTKNIMLQNGEVLLIDMDTLAAGDPIFELGPIYNAFIGFYELDHEAIKDFQGFDFDTSKRFFEKALSKYLGTQCPSKLKEVEDKARIVSYARLISRSVRHGGLESEKGRAEIALWKEELSGLLKEYDTLTFSPCELILPAERECLTEALRFVSERSQRLGAGGRAQMQLEVAVEEIFVNICDYAYGPSKGTVSLTVTEDAEAGSVSVRFEDGGAPFDPLKNRDPDITLPASERQPGGLGVFLAKNLTDDIGYERAGGRNILSFTKKV